MVAFSFYDMLHYIAGKHIFFFVVLHSLQSQCYRHELCWRWDPFCYPWQTGHPLYTVLTMDHLQHNHLPDLVPQLHSHYLLDKPCQH
ncbi:hypothetical protein GDO86_018760 [Hymenochirus boettgeri]|uniref:Uncharacterized protein n=1 Tax=Hymenochirus boettgeri TaxID=247094 RepID=A0A8T2ICJ6_9PIPI|nr:hypothetical protein GDO86_018760 [Hymenochirus boettgeri]